MASDSSSNTTNAAADLMKQLRSHEVAIAELNNLPSSRAIYQQNGSLFFRTTVQTATTTEQSKQLSWAHKLWEASDSSQSTRLLGYREEPQPALEDSGKNQFFKVKNRFF